MTLGSTPQPADVVAELGQSFPYTFPDARTRWLADVGTSAAITFPTSFANKQSVKQVAITALSALGTSHSFPSVNFGANYSGRLIFVIVFAVSKQSADTSGWTITSGSIGGQSDLGPGGMVWRQNGSGSTVMVGNGTILAQPTGTSGTISFSTGAQTRCVCVVLSIASGATTATDFDSANANSTGAAVSLDIPANGILISAAAKADTNSIGFSGVTKRAETSPIAGYQIAWGWDNRLSAETGRSVTFGSTGTSSCVIGAVSRVQG